MLQPSCELMVAQKSVARTTLYRYRHRLLGAALLWKSHDVGRATREHLDRSNSDLPTALSTDASFIHPILDLFAGVHYQPVGGLSDAITACKLQRGPCLRRNRSLVNISQSQRRETSFPGRKTQSHLLHQGSPWLDTFPARGRKGTCW